MNFIINRKLAVKYGVREAMVLNGIRAELLAREAMNYPKRAGRHWCRMSYKVLAAKRELEQIRKQTTELVRQYDMYKARFKSLVHAQTELLDSQSFTINLESLSMFENVPETIDTPGSVYNIKDISIEDNPLDSMSGDDIEIINLEED